MRTLLCLCCCLVSAPAAVIVGLPLGSAPPTFTALGASPGPVGDNTGRIGGGGLVPAWFDAPAPYKSLRPVSAGSTVQILDALYTSSGTGTYYADFRWQYAIPDNTPAPEVPARASSNPAVIAPNASDPLLWDYVSSGTATLTLQTSARTVTATVTAASQSGTVGGVLSPVGYAADSLRHHIDSTIGGAATAASAPSPVIGLVDHNTAPNYVVWQDFYQSLLYYSSPGRISASTYSGGTDATFTLNSGYWLAGRDTTAVPVGAWSPYYRNQGIIDYQPQSWGFGVLISPIHMLISAHTYYSSFNSIGAPGNLVWFIGSDGITYKRTVAAIAYPLSGYVQVGSAVDGNMPDFYVLKLDAALPATVKPAKVMPPDWRAKLPSSGFHAVTMGGHNCSTLTPIESLTAKQYAFYQSAPPVDAAARRFWRLNVPGDSASPIVVWVNGELVLLGLVTNNVSISAANHYAANINADMTTLGGGYQLSVVDLSGFPSY